MKLVVKNLCKSYDTSEIFTNLNFSLDGVSAVGIIGGSGCGKSTLLRQLAGIETPDSGEIFINDMSPITQKKEYQEKIGVVFQQHNLFPHLTIEKNITLLLEKIKKIDKQTAKEKTHAILSELFMLEQKDKLPAQISGGQAQRASIARALATDPEIIFLDEPTAALDPQLTFEVFQSIEKLKDTGIDFIFVTHEMRFLKRFADYFIFVDKGKIIEQGNISELETPKTSQLQEFLQPHLL
ncbi:MAG: ATP-binding cassette domain-containing protein [Bacillota bacterium]